MGMGLTTAVKVVSGDAPESTRQASRSPSLSLLVNSGSANPTMGSEKKKEERRKLRE